ncbi:MAG: hypothetical protein U1C97_01190 [Candidatus Gracilibacteria bacterium]|nr:hypothetical protein [bacterium]MDZ4216916.1 hypothetical protein [Candidatus Gracilibacteria bacterium]
MSKTKTQKTDATPPELTPEFIGKIAADIAVSPILDEHKALFLFLIAQGTFDLPHYQLFIDLLERHYQSRLEEARSLEEEIDGLNKELDQTNVELTAVSIGACKEIQAACEHIEIRTVEQLHEVQKKGEAKQAREMAQKIKNK